MKKKLVSILLIIVIILSSFALSLTAFADSQELILNQMATTSMSGKDDLEWFYYTPEKSGLYSLLSYNIPMSIAYLTVREINPETGKMEMVNLEYVAPDIDRDYENDPDYEKNNHNKAQFCLTYHLEAGKTYYYAVGWFVPTQAPAQFNVLLRCESYDTDAIESIEINYVPDITAYTDGRPKTDENGNSFFCYDLSKLKANATVTIKFSNGTVRTETGADEIIGYKLSYTDNQSSDHWYPDSDNNYTRNRLTVSVLDKTASTNVNVVLGAQYGIKGRVVNFAGRAVKNALITVNGAEKAYTDNNGNFFFYSPRGTKTITISTDTSIDLNALLTIGSASKDLTKTPYILCNCDYVKDGYINAKDYSYIMNRYSGAVPEDLKEEFTASINFFEGKY